jgi:putative superfamily III holin-X
MTDPARPAPSDASTGQLIVQASDDISRLIREEMQLARRDLVRSGKRMGIGVGLFGLAGTLALYGLAALVATAILAIAQGLDPWLSALIVAVVLFVAAGAAALIGKGSVSSAPEPPKERVASVKEDVAVATGHTDEGVSR